MMKKNEYNVLSEREEQVLLMSTKGLTDKEIARKLNLSIATVNTYWVRIRTKLGGANRAELVAAALNKNAEETLTAKESENQRLIGEVVRRAEAERALRESQNRLQAVIDNAPVPIFIKDTQGRYTLVNNEFEKIVGKERREILGRRDHDLFGHDRGEDFRSEDQTVISSHESLETEDDLDSTDGKRSFLTVKFPLFNSEGSVYAVCGISREITKRIDAEKQTREAGAKFRALIENSSDMITLLDETGKILYSSPSTEKVLGYKAQEIIGRNAFHFIAREDIARIKGDFQKLLDNPDTALRAEYRLKNADGESRMVEGLAQNLLQDPVVGALVLNYRDTTEERTMANKLTEVHGELLRDVEKRKLVEHELKVSNEALERRVKTRTIELEESNERLREEIVERKRAEEDLLVSFRFARNVLECSIDGIVGFDSRLRTTVWNHAMEQISGISAEDAMGQCVLDVFPFLGEPADEAVLHRVLAGETVLTSTKPYWVASSGKRGHFEAKFSPVRGSDESIIGGLGVIREITKVG